jgi:hypothetical protein
VLTLFLTRKISDGVSKLGHHHEFEVKDTFEEFERITDQIERLKQGTNEALEQEILEIQVYRVERHIDEHEACTVLSERSSSTVENAFAEQLEHHKECYRH